MYLTKEVRTTKSRFSGSFDYYLIYLNSEIIGILVNKGSNGLIKELFTNLPERPCYRFIGVRERFGEDITPKIKDNGVFHHVVESIEQFIQQNL